MTTETHTDPSIFKNIYTEWCELLEKSLTPHVFMLPEFLSSWWETLGSGKLHVVTVRDEKETLVAIFPFFETTDAGKKTLNLLGCKNVSDYLDIIVHKNYEKEVYEVLQNYLSQKLQWDTLSFCSLPEKSRTRTFLKTFAQNHSLNLTETVQDVTPKIALPATWDSYLAELNRKDRHEIRRKERKLLTNEPSATVTVLSKPEEVRAFLPEFIRLHKLSSQEKEDFWDEAHITFFITAIPALARQGVVKIFVLSIDEKAVATMLLFDYHNRYELYNSGFDPASRDLSPGMVLIGHAIRDAIEQGREVYDFLRGDESYKFKFGAKAEEVFDIEIGKNT